TPAQEKAAILTQTAAAWLEAKTAVAAAKPPANTVYVGAGDLTTNLAYFPSVLKVKAGTTVNFVNRAPEEVHDVAFGPQKWIQGFQQKTDLLPQGRAAPNQATPVYAYGSEPKGKYQYDGTNHGNGFLVTPLTAGSSSPAFGLPRSASVTFTKPGTYKFFC